MKTRLLIIVGIIMITTIPFVTFAALDRYENYLEQLEYERQRLENEPKPGERSFIEPELKAKLERIELDLREKVRQLHEYLPPSSYAVNLNHQTKEIKAMIENKDLIPIIKEFIKKYPKDVVIIVEYGKISFDGFAFRPNDDFEPETFTEPMKNAIFYEDDGHYDYLPINHNPNMMAMEKIELQDDNSIDVEFGQNDYEWSTGYKPIPEFEYTANFQVNDTFAVLCTKMGQDGYAEFHPDLSEPYLPGLGIVKYLGPITIENEPILLFWHESVTIPVDMPCSYPEIIHHSINLWELQEHGLPTDGLVNALGSNWNENEN